MPKVGYWNSGPVHINSQCHTQKNLLIGDLQDARINVI